MKHIEVVAGVIEHDGKILCMERDQGKYDYVSFKWEFPGGKIEDGETHQQALVRELREELQIEVEVLDFIKTIEGVYPEYKVILHCYEVKIVTGEPVLLEHQASRWVAAEEIHNLMWLKSDLDILEDIKKILLSRR